MERFERAKAQQLVTDTLAGPVFGPNVAFGVITPERFDVIKTQVRLLTDRLTAGMHPMLLRAMPDKSEQDIEKTIAQVLPKTTAFAPALTAGELDQPQDLDRLTFVAFAVSCMYTADQLVDRGDEAMLFAIEEFCGQRPEIPTRLMTLVNARLTILDHMRSAIYGISEADAPDVLTCFAQYVLRNEAKLQRMSLQYLRLTPKAQQQFLEENAVEIANSMINDAGFQSITSSLHSVYRQRADTGTLPSINGIHSNPFVDDLLRVCNATARVADECGDWKMDAGHDPEYGIFSINAFNQYHATMVDVFCDAVGIWDDAKVDQIQQAFYYFHESEEQRQASTRLVTDLFFDQMRGRINHYYTGHTPNPLDKYIELCMRVGEISYVNMMGDMKLAAPNPRGPTA